MTRAEVNQEREDPLQGFVSWKARVEGVSGFRTDEVRRDTILVGFLLL